ncbi:MAG: PAS domain S-box protein [Bacteroidota bacterium]
MKKTKEQLLQEIEALTAEVKKLRSGSHDAMDMYFPGPGGQVPAWSGGGGNESCLMSHPLFENLKEEVSIFKIVRDPSGKIIDWIVQEANGQVEKNLGMTGKELIGRSACELFGHGFMSPYLERSERIHQTGGTATFEDYFPLTKKYYVSTLYFLSDDLYVVVSTDITEKKAADEVIRQTNERFAMLFGNVAQGIIFQNREREIVSANPAAERILGLSFAQMTGREPVPEGWRLVFEDGTPCPVEAIPSMISFRTGKKSEGIIGIHEPEKNKLTWVSLHATPEFGPGEEEPYQVFTSLENITPLKEHNRELSRLNLRLETMRKIDFAISDSSMDESYVNEITLRLIMNLIGCDEIDIVIFDYNHNAGVIEARIHGETYERFTGITFPLDMLDLTAFREGVGRLRSIPAKHHKNKAERMLFDHGMASCIAVPLMSDSVLTGLFVLLSRKTGFFTDEHVEISEDIAKHISLAINNRKLHHQLGEYAADLENVVEQRTRDLIELANQYQAILDNAGLAVIVTSARGVIQIFNQAAERMLGYPAAEVIGHLTADCFHDPVELAQYAAELSAIARKTVRAGFDVFITETKLKLPNTREWTYIRRDGSRFPVKLTISPFENADGIIQGYIGIAIDFTQEKLALEKIRLSEEQFHNMFRNHAAIMLLVNPETGNIVDANNAADTFFGFDPGYLKQANLSDINILKQEFLVKNMQQALRGEMNYFISPYKLASGRVRTVEVRTSPVEGKSGTLLFSVINDITERIEAEEALLKSEEKYRIVADNTYDWEFWQAPDERFIYQSPSCRRITGYDANEFYRNNQLFVSMIHPEDLDRFLEHQQKVMTSSEPESMEFRIITSDGTLKWIDHGCLPVFDDHGNFLGIRGSIRDITERKLAVERLQVREAENRAIVNAVPDLLFRLDRNGVFLDYKSSEPEYLNVPQDAIIGGSVTELLPENMTGMMLQALEQSFNSPGPVTFEYTLLMGNKSRYFENRVARITDNEALVIIRDVTDQKIVLNELKMHNAAFESFALAIIITDIDGIITWANKSFTTLSGYRMDEIIGHSTRELMKSGKMEMPFYDDMWNTILDNKVWSGELINRKKDDTVYWEEMTISPLHNPSGIITGFIAIKIDITGRKHMEQALRESEARWGFALEGSGDGVWDLNLVTNEVFYSDSWIRMLGYEPGEFPFTVDEWDKHIHPDDHDRVYSSLNEYINGKLPNYNLEYRLLCKNGVYKWILTRGKLIAEQPGHKPVRMIGTHTDITERINLEQTLRESVAKEKELNSLKSKFISVASHEFKTPLATIMATNETLKYYRDRMTREEQDQRISNINTQVEYLNTIIEELLQLSRIQTKELVIEPQPFDLVALLAEMTAEFNDHPGEETRLQFHCDEQSLEVLLDKKMIRQALTNLVSNAFKYSDPLTKVTMRLHLNQDFFELRIADKGIGIPPEDIKHLFKPFYRASNVGMVSGTGLGLNIVQEIIGKHGGKIELTSKLNEGTEIIIHLPVTAEQP